MGRHVHAICAEKKLDATRRGKLQNLQFAICISSRSAPSSICDLSNQQEQHQPQNKRSESATSVLQTAQHTDIAVCHRAGRGRGVG
jgi:hypothetical protein